MPDTIVSADIDTFLKTANNAAARSALGAASTSEVALKAALSSPALTGTPTAPTAAANTNTTQLATTAFVTAAIAEALGGDVTAPTLLSTTPSDDATGVAITSNLTATFSETVQFHTAVSISIKLTSGGTTVESFDETDIGSAISISGSTLTINPTDSMANDTSHYVTIGATSIKDTAGNFFAGIGATSTWNFTTVSAGAVSETPTSYVGFTAPTRRYCAASLAASADNDLISSIVGLHVGASTATASGGERPTKQTLGSYNVLRFNGTANLLRFAEVNSITSYAMIVALKKNATGGTVVAGSISDASQLLGLSGTAVGGSVTAYDIETYNTASSAVDLSALAVITVTSSGATTTTSGEFEIGRAYVIVDTGDTDFTEIGASTSDPGTRFTATGVGTGTGTASTNDVAFTRNGTSAGTAQAFGVFTSLSAAMIGATDPTNAAPAGFASMDLAEFSLWNSIPVDLTTIRDAVRTHYGL